MSDDSAFEAMYEAHYEDLLRYAVRRVSEPADAADVVAETWVVAWRRRDELPPDAERRLWLFGVTRRVLANQRRGQLRRVRLADRLRDELNGFTVTREFDSPALSALRRLSEQDQELLRLLGWEQLEPHEVAVVLGISASTARVRIHRARTRLRAAMRAETDGRDTPTGTARPRPGIAPPDVGSSSAPSPGPQRPTPVRGLAKETS